MSPTQRSLKLLRDRGCLVAVVEHWNVFARIRQDLWGADIVAIEPGQPGVLFIQTTTGDNASKRVAKLMASPGLPLILAAGNRVVVHSWRKLGAKGKRKLWNCDERLLGLEGNPSHSCAAACVYLAEKARGKKNASVKRCSHR